MIFLRSTDGILIDRVSSKPSIESNVDGNVHLNVSSDETILNANSWYIVDETPVRPADDATNTYIHNIVNVALGAFQKQGVHDAARHTARLQQESEEAKFADVRVSLPDIRQIAIDARSFIDGGGVNPGNVE